MTTCIDLESGIKPIHYGQNIVADEMYFENPIVYALAIISNPWDMEEVINTLRMPSKPSLLTRQVNWLKYNRYDKSGHVAHRSYTIRDHRVVECMIESPFKDNFHVMEPSMSSESSEQQHTPDIQGRDRAYSA